MALSRLAREFAAEIQQHDWSDAPWRLDRAGHSREHDTNRGVGFLSADETAAIRTNVMWVVAQVLGHADPNFSPDEFAAASGVSINSGFLYAGLRRDMEGRWSRPGTWEFGNEEHPAR